MQQQRKKCAFGFSCAAMMQQPGLLASDCLNADTCGLISDLPLDRPITFYRRIEVDGQYERQVITLTSRQAATMMLLARGCPQSPESLGATLALEQVQSAIDRMRSRLNDYDTSTYIAPPETETHTHNVKRPRGTYQYNKLACPHAIFEPSEKTEKVKVIHLSHDDDPRNKEARAGIERRNKLIALTAKLNAIEQSIGEVLATL